MVEEIKRGSDEKAKAAFVNTRRYTDWLEQLIAAHKDGDDVTIALMKLGLDMLDTIRELEYHAAADPIQKKLLAYDLLEQRLRDGTATSDAIVNKSEVFK